MLGAAFGVSLILGPPLGGLVADYNPSLPFVLSILEGVILLGTLRFLLPEPTAKKPKDRKDSGERSHERRPGEPGAAPAVVGSSGRGCGRAAVLPDRRCGH